MQCNQCAKKLSSWKQLEKHTKKSNVNYTLEVDGDVMGRSWWTTRCCHFIWFSLNTYPHSLQPLFCPFDIFVILPLKPHFNLCSSVNHWSPTTWLRFVKFKIATDISQIICWFVSNIKIYNNEILVIFDGAFFSGRGCQAIGDVSDDHFSADFWWVGWNDLLQIASLQNCQNGIRFQEWSTCTGWRKGSQNFQKLSETRVK